MKALRAQVSGRLSLLVLVAAGLGALAGLGHSPFDWPFVTLLAFAALFWLAGAEVSPRRAAVLGWAAGSGYFAVTLHWIVNPFYVDAANQAWMAPFALVFMATGLALFWGVAFGLARRVAPGRALPMVAGLVLAEMARSYLLTGFPWGLVAYIWVDTPVMQLAAWTGPHGLTFLTLLIAALPLLARPPILRFALAPLFVAGTWAAGVSIGAQPVPPPAEQVHLRLVQPNAPQHLKWDRATAQMFFQRQLDLSLQPSEVKPDFIIWPETAVTFWLGESPEAEAMMARTLAPDSRLVFGAIRAAGRRAYNALAVLDQDGVVDQVYDKSRLVPFGEYIPLGDVLADFGIQGLAARDGQGFSAGPGRQLLDLGAAGQVMPLICYEAIFPQLVNGWTARPDWILQITNDAWFGHVAGPQQHLAQAQFRAVEQGLPLVRVANTGISGVIDARGRIRAAIPLDEAGFLDVDLPGALPQTLYSRTGDWLVLILSLFLLISPGIKRRSI